MTPDLREAVARIIDPVAWEWRDRDMYLDTIQGDIDDTLAKADAILSLPALSVPEGWRKALEFYRDAWSLVTEGDEPDPVYGGGGITSQYLEPSTALLDDQGKRARDALSAPGGEGSSRPWPQPVAQATSVPRSLAQGEGDATTPEAGA